MDEEISRVRQARANAVPDAPTITPEAEDAQRDAFGVIGTRIAEAAGRYNETVADIDAREAELDKTTPDADLFSRIATAHHVALRTTVGTGMLILATMFFFLLDTIGLIAKAAMLTGEYGLMIAASEQEAEVTAKARLAAIDNDSLRDAARQEAAARSEFAATEAWL